MSIAKKVFKNISLVLAAQSAAHILNFFYFIVLARSLGPRNLGVFSFALVLAGTLGIIGDAGMRKIQIRDMARYPDEIKQYFSKILFLKTIFIICVFGLLLAWIFIWKYSDLTRKIIIWLSFAKIIESFSQNFFGVFQAKQIFRYEAIAVSGRSFLLLAGALLISGMECSMVGFAVQYVLVNMAVILFCLIMYVREFSGFPRVVADWNFGFLKIKESLPFGISNVSEFIYQWLDTVMLQAMTTDVIVGLYSAAYRIFYASLFIPSTVSMVFFPLMAQFYIKSKQDFCFVAQRFFKYLSVIGVLIAGLLILLADKIVLLLYGQSFTTSALALRVLVGSFLLICLNSAFVQVLSVSNRQVSLMKICLSAAAINVLCNIVLIPRYGFVGASVATVISEFWITVLTIFFVVQDKNGVSWKSLWLYLLKIIVLCLALGFLLVLLGEKGTLLLRIIVFLSIFVTGLVFLRCFDRNDYETLVLIFNKREITAKQKGLAKDV